MKNKRKPLIFLFAALLAMNVFATNALATEIPKALSDSQVITPQHEETEWVYRNNDGVIQKRCWSLTYAKWLTDWINV